MGKMVKSVNEVVYGKKIQCHVGLVVSSHGQTWVIY